MLSVRHNDGKARSPGTYIELWGCSKTIVMECKRLLDRDFRVRLTITRRRGACDTCRRRKVRCDGYNPCGSCKKVRLSCHYPTVRTTTPFSSSQSSSAAVNISQHPDSTDPGCISLETLTDFDEHQSFGTWNLSPWDMSSTYSSAGDHDMKPYMEAKWPSFTDTWRGADRVASLGLRYIHR
ncbi:hypothetical protein LX32DRAFT_411522 [Colletotrichum zoysiae]|uniref:Zn(2)-C6 fungal-type domain-containing protein n=1 Tax=Colletotrichum zoysiae TaxID=1216348 RepID=A0AAD9M152_9PEZI|nr:hypothetical protein LX32DRAFT_411522 [Colletotrichum zoysiae]